MLVDYRVANTIVPVWFLTGGCPAQIRIRTSRRCFLDELIALAAKIRSRFAGVYSPKHRGCSNVLEYCGGPMPSGANRFAGFRAWRWETMSARSLARWPKFR